MATTQQTGQELSPWWKIGVIFTIFVGFSVLIFIAVKAYKDAPPIPLRVVNAGGETVFTREDILAGQQVFLKYALMENGTIWGHGAYLGPDFSAAYLHDLALEAGDWRPGKVYGRSLADSTTPSGMRWRARCSACSGESLQPPNPDSGLLGTGNRVLSVADRPMGRLFRPPRKKRRLEGQIYRQPP